MVAAVAVPASAELDLRGSWHVLAHYQEPGSEHPERWQWQDRLWVFEPEGERLRLTEYPHVAFDDTGGRYERGMNGQWIQVEGTWEPDASQLREIERGLSVNPRGAITRTLRRTETGWRSARRGGYDSARFVVFEAIVEIDTTGATPVFEFRDRLGSSAAHGREGLTAYRGEAVGEEGRLVEGSYERDGRQQGRFAMRRSGAARSETEAPPSGNEKQETYERFYRQLGRELRGDDALPARFAGGDPAAREALHADVVAALEGAYRNQGNDPRPFAPQIRKLADGVVALYLEGLTRDEIGARVQDGRLRP